MSDVDEASGASRHQRARSCLRGVPGCPIGLCISGRKPAPPKGHACAARGLLLRQGRSKLGKDRNPSPRGVWCESRTSQFRPGTNACGRETPSTRPGSDSCAPFPRMLCLKRFSPKCGPRPPITRRFLSSLRHRRARLDKRGCPGRKRELGPNRAVRWARTAAVQYPKQTLTFGRLSKPRAQKGRGFQRQLWQHPKGAFASSSLSAKAGAGGDWLSGSST